MRFKGAIKTLRCCDSPRMEQRARARPSLGGIDRLCESIDGVLKRLKQPPPWGVAAAKRGSSQSN